MLLWAEKWHFLELAGPVEEVAVLSRMGPALAD